MPLRTFARTFDRLRARGPTGYALAAVLVLSGALIDEGIRNAVGTDIPQAMLLPPLLAVGALCSIGPIVLAVGIITVIVAFQVSRAGGDPSEILTGAATAATGGLLVVGTVFALTRGWRLAAAAREEADQLRALAERHAAEAEAARVEAQASAEMAALLQSELRHRMRNLLSVIGGLASASFRSGDQQVNLRQFRGRLAAHIAANELVFGNSTGEIGLHQLARTVLASFPLDRLDLSGRDASVRAGNATVLGLALHELATNARKYGAWSNETGHVSLRVEMRADGDIACIEWKERGGPEPAPEGPGSRKGFGTSLLGQMLAGALNGEVVRELRPEGLLWRFVMAPRRPAAQDQPAAE